MTFTDCAGRAEANQDWVGKVQVLIWFDRHPASRYNVTKLENVYRRYADQGDRVVFRAICVERPDSMTADDVQHLVGQWQSSMPVTRDLVAAGREALDIAEAPTIVVLDGQHRLQLFEVGANPEIDTSIQVVLERLLAGDNVAADVLRNFELTEDRFQRQLQLAALNPDGVAPSEASELAAAADFRKLQATVAWQTDQIAAPGNLLLAPTSPVTATRLWVLDGMREVVELDANGQIVARHSLDLEEGAFVGQLRHVIDARQTAYFLGFSQLGRHVFLFDQQFQQVLSYPAEGQQHNGIMDAELMDLDEDGELELYVAFADPHGCHRVDLTGRRAWSNRRLPAALSLAGDRLTHPAQLWVTGERGWLLPIGAGGQEGQPVAVPQRTIHQITASTSPTARPAQFMGMSYSIEGRLIAVGLDESLQEQWSYGLPAGVFRHQVRSPLWAPLWGDALGCWLLAGPDGSVHVIRDDGSFFDNVNLGDDVLGLTGAGGASGGRIYIATPGKVTAYDVRLPN